MTFVRAELQRPFQLGRNVLIHDISQVLYLPFDHDDGSYARDRSGHVNHGTIYGATRVAGKVAGALSFDGIDDLVTVANSSSLNFESSQDFSISLWIKTSGSASEKGIICKRVGITGYQIYLQGGVNAFAFIGDGSNQVTASGGAINDNVWHFIVATFDRDAYLKVYKDGLLIQQANISAIGNITNSKILEIANELLSSYYLTGVIDEPRIYNRDLSQAEIVRVMNLRGI